MIIILFIILFLFCWAVLHGGTRDKQPTPIYDCDSDWYDNL